MRNIYKTNYLCIALLAGLASYAIEARATSPDGEISQVLEQESKGVSFDYQLEERPDPFLPFISDKVATQNINADDIIDEDVDLSGMRKFEPGQLTLVAVMFASSQNMAMVEDVTGKGYVLTEGMPIGRRGIISRIEDGQVTVVETAHTRAGRKLENTIVMRLNKEGEK